MRDVNWHKILEGIKKGDSSCVEQFVLELQNDLYKFCFFLCGNKQLSQDLCHDSFIKALSNIHKLKRINNVKGWIRTLAKNIYLDFLKSAKNSKVHISCFSDEEMEQMAMGELNYDEGLDVRNCLAHLNDEERLILITVDIEGYSYAEAAEILEISEPALRSRLFKVRRKFETKYLETIGTAKSLYK